MGSLPVTRGSIEVPINGLFVMGADAVDHRRSSRSLLYKSRWGLQVRATVSQPRHGRRGRHRYPQRSTG